jgi:hypothetical protein
MTEMSFAERIRQNSQKGFAQAKATQSGSSNFFKLDKGISKFRLLMDFDNVLIYLAFRAHGGKSADGKFEQTVDLGWLRRQPKILERMIETGKLTEDQAAEIVAYGDPATNLFFYLLKGLGMESKQIRKIGKDSPASSPRALWNVWGEDDGAVGILETSAGPRGSLVKWFDEQAQLRGVDELLGPSAYVEVTGTGDGFDRSYNYALYREPMEFPDDLKTYDLVSHLASKVKSPHEKLEFVRRTYPAHLLEAGISNPETLFDRPADEAEAEPEA